MQQKKAKSRTEKIDSLATVWMTDFAETGLNATEGTDGNIIRDSAQQKKCKDCYWIGLLLIGTQKENIRRE